MMRHSTIGGTLLTFIDADTDADTDAVIGPATDTRPGRPATETTGEPFAREHPGACVLS